MYCQECGKFNPDPSKTCQNCGSTLEDTSKKPTNPMVNDVAQQALKKLKSVDVTAVSTSFKKINKKTKILVGVACASIILLSILFSLVSSLSSPERVIKRYVENCISGDYDQAYNTIAMPDSPFVTKDAFASYMQQSNQDFANIMNYEILDYEKTLSRSDSTYNSLKGLLSESLMKLYSVSYVLHGESKTRDLMVILVNQNQKRFLFFDTYKITISDMFVNDYTIYAPEDVKVTIDGIELPVSKDSEKSSLKAYKVSHLFSGKHDLKITSNIYEDYKEVISPSSKDSETFEDFTLKESVRADLAKQAETTFKSLCVNAVAGNDFSKVEGLFTEDTSALNSIKEKYTSLCDGMKLYDGSGLKSISFQSFTDRNYTDELSYTNRYVCKLNYTYDYVMSYVENQFNEDTAEYEEVVREASSSDNQASVEVTLEYIDKSWRIHSISDYSINYSID